MPDLDLNELERRARASGVYSMVLALIAEVRRLRNAEGEFNSAHIGYAEQLAELREQRRALMVALLAATGGGDDAGCECPSCQAYRKVRQRWPHCMDWTDE